MLFLRKTIVAISLLLLTTAYSCQNAEIGSDTERQTKITTMYRQYAQEFPQVKGISARELQQLQREGKNLVLIDVRSPEEIAVSRIPGAVTVEEFESDLRQYRNVTAIAYCTIGYRSGLYAQKLQQQGLEILNLEGSLLSWSYVGGKLVNSSGATNQIHVFGRQWRLTAQDYEAVW